MQNSVTPEERSTSTSRRELEKSILAELMADGNYFERVSEYIGIGDFSVREYAIIFKRMTDLYLDGEAIDFTNVAADERVLQAATELVDICRYSGNVVSHARQLKELSTRESCFDLLINSVADLEEGAETETVIDQLQSQLYRIERLDRSSAILLEDLPEEVFRPQPSIVSGFAPLKHIKFTNGSMIVVAGRPSMGKTAFCLKVALNVASAGFPVLIFSLEMSNEQVYHRLVSMSERIPLSQFAEENASAFERARTASCRRLPIYIDDRGSLTAEQLKRSARNLIRKQGIRLIVIDYLQQMRGSGTKNNYEETTDIANDIKSIAKELDVPIVVASQLNRNVEGTQEKRPSMADLRGSGAIEENADIIMFPWRPSVYKKSTDQCEAKIIVAKNRQGETGEFDLLWFAPYTLFEHKGQA